MATTAEVAALRALINEPTDETYSDEQLSLLIDTAGSVNAAGSEVWLSKAAQYATLVNVSESGSSRNLGDLHKNALAMAKQLGAEADEDTSAATGIRIRRITRR